jgi:hypothetical protein
LAIALMDRTVTATHRFCEPSNGVSGDDIGFGAGLVRVAGVVELLKARRRDETGIRSRGLSPVAARVYQRVGDEVALEAGVPIRRDR